MPRLVESAYPRTMAFRITCFAWMLGVLPLLAGKRNVSVTVTPNPVTARTGEATTFKAAVSGTTSTAVTWSCSGGQPINPDGTFPGTWTPGTFTIKATLVSDPTKAGTATLIVDKTVSVSLSPSSSQVRTDQPLVIKATVLGGTTPSPKVVWSLSGDGTVTSTGDLSATFTTSTGGRSIITAQSAEDASAVATALVDAYPPSSVSITLGASGPAVLTPFAKSHVYARVAGGSTNQVTWSAQGIQFLSDPESLQGAATVQGLADIQMPGTDGTYTVTATSVDDPMTRATLEFTVAHDGTTTIYGISAANPLLSGGQPATLTPAYNPRTLAASLSPSVGTVLDGKAYAVMPATMTSYTLSVKVDAKNTLTEVSDWVSPAIPAKAGCDADLNSATAFSSRWDNTSSLDPVGHPYRSASVLIAPDGRIVVAGGGSITPGDYGSSGTGLPLWHFPVPDERIWDPVARSIVSTRPLERASHAAALLPDGTALYAGGALRKAIAEDPDYLWGTYGAESDMAETDPDLGMSYFPDMYQDGAILPTLTGELVALGGVGAWMEWASADHMWYYTSPRLHPWNDAVLLTPGSSASTTVTLLSPRGKVMPVLLKDGRILVGEALGTPGRTGLWASPEILDPKRRTTVLSSALKGFLDTRHQTGSSSIEGAKLMEDGKVLILEKALANGALWIGIWDPTGETYTRKVQVPRIDAISVGDPIGDGLYPLGFVQRTELTRPNGHVVWYEAPRNRVVVTTDLGFAAADGSVLKGQRWFGMTAQGEALVEAASPHGVGQLWRIGLDLPVNLFPERVTATLAQQVRFKAFVKGTETPVWSILEGSLGGTVAQDGTYLAPATAGIYHVVATTSAGRAVSTVQVIPWKPMVRAFACTPASGPVGGSVTLSWSVSLAEAIHLEALDASFSVLQSWDGSGKDSLSVLVPAGTASFRLTAQNASGTGNPATTFFKLWDLWSVQIHGPSYVARNAPALYTASMATNDPAVPTGVVWSLTSGPSGGGAISPEGRFSGSLPGTYVIRATSTWKPSVYAEASVLVGDPAVLSSFSASPSIVPRGDVVRFSWTATGATSLILSTPGDAYGNPGQSWNLSGYSSYALAPAKTATYTLSATNAFGGASASVTVTVSPVTAIGITPASATAYVGTPLTFGASITSTGSTAVTWSTDDPKGILTANGLSATYTSGAAPGIFHVTVTSALDPARSATSTVTVIRPQVTLSVTPLDSALVTGQSLSLGSSIQVTGSSDTSLIWTCSGGSILPKGAAAFYTAPLIPGLYTVTATSAANPDVSATSTIQVSVPSSSTPALAILPQVATLLPGQRLYLGAAYATTDLSLGLDWAATGGNLAPDASTASAFFSSPVAGTYTVTATSRATTSLVSLPAGITVNSALPPAWAVMPSALTMATGQSTLLEAMDSSGAIREKVTWTILEGAAGGLVTDAGQYFAPTTVGTYHAVGTNPDDPSQTATVTITVLAGGGWSGTGNTTATSQGVTVAPDAVSIPSGTYQSLSAVVAGLDDQTVTWTVENAPAAATVDASGVFVANQPGTYRVFAISAANPVLNGSAVITVVSSITPLAGAPSGTWKGYSVTALQNGKILIAGGYDGVNYLGAAYLYDPDSKTFAPTGSLLQARGWHTATLLNDGRVLIAGGSGYFKWPTDPNAITQLQGVRWGEIYDSASGTFQALPVPPGFPTFPAGLMRGAHSAPMGTGEADSGAAALLANGQVLVVGGTDDPKDYWINRSDVFTPATGTFDFSNLVPDPSSPGSYMWIDASNYVNTWIGTAVVKLLDGRALMTGGGQGTSDGGRMPLTESKIFDGATQAFTTVAPMLTPRLGHTLTVLVDGRVLATGGYVSFQLASDGWWHGISAKSAEIYDPASNTWTAIADMNEARADHAAILLPTGKVMIIGGRTQYGDGSYAWPKTSELFDPDSGTFSVMDHLDYGLEEPKLALMQDGSVFVAGQVQAPSGAQTAQYTTKASKLMTADSVLNVWSTLFGTIATPSSNIFAAYPLNEVIQAQLNRAVPPLPTYSYVSIPLPIGFGLANNDPGDSPLPTFMNSIQRSFILAVWKPTREFNITDINVDLVVGAFRQRVLAHQPTATFVFHQINAMTPLVNSGSTSINWASAWMSTIQHRADAIESTRGRVEFYSVQVTFSPDLLSMSAVPYGLSTNQAVTLPPGGQISYDFQIFGATDPNAAIKSSSQMFSSSITVKTTGLWSAAQFFQNAWFGTWDNDKWCDYPTFEWLSINAPQPGPQSLVGPVNDISLEHGKKGDHANHMDGTMLDMFHPGYRSYVDADMPGSGTIFRDSHIFSDLRLARSGDPAAQARLRNWITAARNNLTAIFDQLPTSHGYRLNAAIYMVTSVEPGYRTFYDSPTDDPTWNSSSALKKSDPTNANQLQRKQCVNDGKQIYQLLLRGNCDPYQIFDDQSEPVLVANGVGLNLGIGETDAESFQPRFYAWLDQVHTNHLHLFLKK